MGNTGVTKIAVVERGTLQRGEAREDRLDGRDKILKVRSGAGSGELPRE